MSHLPGEVESDRSTAQTRLTTRVPILSIQGRLFPRELSKLQPARTSWRSPLVIKGVKNNSMNCGRGRSRGHGGRRDQSITHLRRQITTLGTELRDANTGRFSKRTSLLLKSSKETKTWWICYMLSISFSVNIAFTLFFELFVCMNLYAFLQYDVTTSYCNNDLIG